MEQDIFEAEGGKVAFEKESLEEAKAAPAKEEGHEATDEGALEGKGKKGKEGEQATPKPLDLKAMKKEELIALTQALIFENSRLAESCEDLKKEKDGAMKRAKELSRRYLSLSGDFEQYKKRNAEIERESFDKATAEVALKLIPVYDNLRIALDSIPDQTSKEGVSMIYRQFDEALASLGITEIKAEGEAFDPMLHNALAAEDTDDESLKGKVKAVITGGYLFKDKVIKQSQVIVYR